ncbi:hypothetical protein [Beijerinckia mobilis]|uniref:hypothetical protein n=1 Tax=Beijerinckia mobilis TaxID=231434 RepID=UPI001FD97617|nr:hypothetical protein [Beijerinckia mobilis]
MYKTLLSGLVAGAVIFATLHPANAFSRNGSFTGARGTTSWGGSGSCSGGSCSHSAGGTGPAGRSWNRQGSSSCANGTCSGSGTYTGPRGGTVQHGYSVSR